MQEVTPFFDRASVWQVITAVVAIWAVVATLVAPFIGSRLSVSWQRLQERNRLKLWVFGSLMQDRANPGSIDAVRAYNLIDSLFHDARGVRDKWHEYYDSLSDHRLNSNEGWSMREGKRTNLLRTMAEEIGFGRDFSSVDFSRIYWPEGLAQTQELEALQRKVATQQLVQQLAQQNYSGTDPGTPP